MRLPCTLWGIHIALFLTDIWTCEIQISQNQSVSNAFIKYVNPNFTTKGISIGFESKVTKKIWMCTIFLEENETSE